MKAWDRLVVIVFFGLIAAVSVWDIQRASPQWLHKQDHLVTVYFSNDDATGLVAEKRLLQAGDDPIERTLYELLQGPEDANLGRTIPDGVEVLETRLSDGTLYVNFSEELRTNHWGGSTGEIFTVYSIVNSLTEIPGVERIFILLDGVYEETLVGHLILDEAFVRDESIIAN